MSPVGLIAVDIDGTLLDSRQRVSERNAATLRTAEGLGIEVALSTGKNYARAARVGGMLGFSSHLICSNGAYIRTAGGITIGRNALDPAVANEVIRAAGRFAERGVLTFEPTANAKFGRETAQESIDMSSMPGGVTVHAPLQITLCGSQAQMQHAVLAIRQMPLANRVAVSTVHFGGDGCAVDIGPAEATKGIALACLCAHLKIAPENVAAIGDNFNDCEMLEFAAHPFVVANAPQEMKTRGWCVVPSNDDDGVACAVERVLRSA